MLMQGAHWQLWLIALAAVKCRAQRVAPATKPVPGRRDPAGGPNLGRKPVVRENLDELVAEIVIFNAHDWKQLAGGASGTDYTH